MMIPVLEENLSARKMCLGGHIFLGNPVLLDNIYCPPKTRCPLVIRMLAIMQFCLIPPWSHGVLLNVVATIDDTIYDDMNGTPSQCTLTDC